MIISGRPSQGDLYTAWFNIYEEFLDGMQDKTGQYKMKLLKRINQLSFDLELIELCVRRLKVHGHSDEILDILRKHVHVTGEFNPEDQETYLRNLQIVLNRTGRMRQEIIEKKAEYDILEKKAGGKGEATERQFDSLIAQVSLFARFHIDKKTFTVTDFTELYTAMRETSEMYDRQIEKAKR